MRVIINGVVASPAEHPRLAYLSQHRDKRYMMWFCAVSSEFVERLSPHADE
jgi:hypothetical protein